MRSATIFGTLMVGALLAHGGSPYLAFALGLCALVAMILLALLATVSGSNIEGSDHGEA
jgi:hypothetical protein